MKGKISFIALATFVMFFFACNENTTNNENQVDSVETEMVYPNTKTFYQADTIGQNSLLIADPILCDVMVKPSPNNEWEAYQLENTDTEALENVIYQAIYQGRLTPYSYKDDQYFGEEYLDQKVSIDEIKEFEKKYKDSPIAKILFEEEWYFNEETLQMSKKVKSIIFGYELINSQGEVYGHEAVFKVYFDNPEKNSETI